MRDGFWLSDAAWAAIEPLLPHNQPGARRVDEPPCVISGSNDSAIKLSFVAIRNTGVHWKRAVERTAAMGQFEIPLKDCFSP